MTHSRTISTITHLRSRMGKVCVALQAPTVDELLERAEAARADSHFLEFRLDCLGTPHLATPAARAAAVRTLGDFLHRHSDVAAIATCRRKPFGGGFPGSLADELSVLVLAAECGFDLLDLELESAEEATPAQLDSLRSVGAPLMISFHEFHGAPEPEPIYSRIRVFAPDFAKIVTSARTLSDGFQILRWVNSRSRDAQLVGIAMGECGLPSRILGIRAGSAFTFASAPGGAPTAPGQVSARVLKDLYNIESLDSATRIYGVAGNPVSHSLSPLMQNTAFHRERLNAVYLPLKTESLDDLLALADQLPLSGLSITMPYKQTIMAHLANVDPMTAKLGACNTVRMGADGRFYGFNTDVAGILRPLEKRMSVRNTQALVLGAGGAARAAAFGLADRGAHVSLWSRSESRTRDFAGIPGIQVISRKEIPATRFDILINATPCGMHGNPHPLPLEEHEWHARLVFDLVYNPLDTPLLQAARARGLTTIQGVEMFVHQGARQFELWTGKPAPEADMLRVVLHALSRPR